MLHLKGLVVEPASWLSSDAIELRRDAFAECVSDGESEYAKKVLSQNQP